MATPKYHFLAMNLLVAIMLFGLCAAMLIISWPSMIATISMVIAVFNVSMALIALRDLKNRQ